MTTLTHEIAFAEGNDAHLESSNWLTFLGFVFLIATVFHELVGIAL